MKGNYFINRRTIRRYDSSRPLPESMLEDMIVEAAHAPTTGNMQLYSVVVSTSPEEKAQLSPAHFGQPQVQGCAALVTVCADYRRFVRWCEVSGADPGYDNFQSLMAAILDATAFAQQLTTIAEMRGLGVCWLGTTTYNAPQIAEALCLPEMVVPVTTLSIGWPADEGEDAGRLPSEAIIHMGKYNDPTDSDIIRFYAEKEERDDSRRFVAENGRHTLAQVFTDIRYPRANNERFSKVYLDFIRRQGFKM